MAKEFLTTVEMQIGTSFHFQSKHCQKWK